MDLTFRDLEARGIDTSTVAVCEKIRKLAKLDRLKLDLSEHRSGLNRHLFDYLDYCGVDKLDFIKGYLSYLQPYMIERKRDQEFEKGIICVIDNIYKVSVYIKINSKQFEELVVSFHEDNIRGVAKSNSALKVDIRKYVLVFADEILGYNEADNKYGVKVFIQRGLKVLPLELVALKCEKGFLVYKRYIDLAFLDYCNEYIRDLYTSSLDLDFEKIDIFSMLQQISFTSYGNGTFSSISLLIDSLCIQRDYLSKQAADFALVTFVQNLKITTDQRDDLLNLLNTKFKVSSIKGIDVILRRIEDNLFSIDEKPITKETLQANYINKLIESIGDNKK